MPTTRDGAPGSDRLRPPALGLLLAEARSLFEFNASVLLSPLLMRAPRGRRPSGAGVAGLSRQ